MFIVGNATVRRVVLVAISLFNFLRHLVSDVAIVQPKNRNKKTTSFLRSYEIELPRA